MNQQINLYQPIFRKQKKVFSAIAMLQVFCIATVLFSLTGAYSYLQVRDLHSQEQVSSRRLSAMQKEIKELQDRKTDNTEAKLLQAEMIRLNSEVSEKQRISRVLSQGPYSNTSGFSKHFEAIARQHVNGAWLTSIGIEDGGSSLNLNGVTFSAELVPVYLQRLLREDVFSKTSFNVLGMERSKDNEDEIHFKVSTRTGGKPDGSS